MLNELFILGELLEGPQNGYSLRNALQSTLGRHRKLSYGALYPLLNKLEKSGDIILNEDKSKNKKKNAYITQKGKKRFFEMMNAPVPKNAYMNDIFLIKLDAMQHLSLDKQYNLLNEYILEQKENIIEIKDYLEKLNNENTIDHWYAKQRLTLSLQQAELAKNWAQNFKKKLGDMRNE